MMEMRLKNVLLGVVLLVLAFAMIPAIASPASCTTKTFTDEAGYVACAGVTPYAVTGAQVDGTPPTSDPHSRYQWALRQLLQGETYNSLFSDAPRDVIVAVIDGSGPGGSGPIQPDGTRAPHPDLDGVYLPGWNFVTGTADTSVTWDGLNPAEGNSHGQCVASIIGAKHDGAGMAGVFHRAKIIPIQSDFDHLAEAIDYAVAQGAEVIHVAGFASAFTSGVSLDYVYHFLDLYPPFPPRRVFWNATDRNHYVAIFRDIARAVDDANEAGVLTVVPIGNWAGRITTQFMAEMDGVIAVGASNINGEISPHNSTVYTTDVFAPGGDRRTVSFPLTLPSDIFAVNSTSNGDDPLCAAGPNLYSFGALTSMAAPHVSGAIAIIKSYLPNATPAEVRRLLRKASLLPTANFNIMQGVAGVLSLKVLRTLLP